MRTHLADLLEVAGLSGHQVTGSAGVLRRIARNGVLWVPGATFELFYVDRVEFYPKKFIDVQGRVLVLGRNPALEFESTTRSGQRLRLRRSLVLENSH